MAVPVLGADADGDLGDEAHLGEVAVHAAVHEPVLVETVDVGTLLGVVGVHETVLIFGQERGNHGEDEDDQDDTGSRHGGLVLAEADPGILKVADGLVVKLHVGKTLAHVDESKLLGADFLILVCHLTVPPF